MAVSRVRDWKPDMEYVVNRVPDKIQVASILNEAKGNRTMAQFAEECQTSASTFSRLINGKNTKSMPIALIIRIADNAAKHSDDLFGRLMMANGYVPKDVYDKVPETPLELQYQQRGICETKACNIVLTELLKRGIPVKLLDRSAKLKILERPYYLSTSWRLQIEINLGEGPIIWSFMSIPYKHDDIDYKYPYNGVHPMTIAERMYGWFLLDAWLPEKLNNRLHSFLFVDTAVCSEFKDLLDVNGPKVNNDISFISVNLDEERVDFEAYMNRKDGKKHELLFSRPVIEADNNATGCDDDAHLNALFYRDKEYYYKLSQF